MRSAARRGFSTIHSRSVTSASSAAYSVALSSGTCPKVLFRLLGARRVLEHLLERHAGVAEMALGEVVHAVRRPAGIERVGHQHGVVERRDLDAVLGEHVEIVLDVLPDLEDRRVLQQRLQQRQRLAHGTCTMPSCVAEVEAVRLARWPSGT